MWEEREGNMVDRFRESNEKSGSKITLKFLTDLLEARAITSRIAVSLDNVSLRC